MAKAAKRRGAPREFNYAERARERQLGNGAYGKLWGIVDGGVKDALQSHPDYLTPKGRLSARTSIVKRVTGTVIGFAEQSAKGRGNSAEKEDGSAFADPQATVPREAEAGAGATTPARPHCRIGKITMKAQAAEIAVLRDELLAERVGRKLLEDLVNSRRAQPRDDTGRFVSKRKRINGELAHYIATTTREQREEAFQAYIEGTRSDRKRGKGVGE